MSKFKVLKLFRDLKENRRCEVGDVIEITDDRAEEITSKLGKDFIEEVAEVKKVASKPKKTK